MVFEENGQKFRAKEKISCTTVNNSSPNESPCDMFSSLMQTLRNVLTGVGVSTLCVYMSNIERGQQNQSFPPPLSPVMSKKHKWIAMIFYETVCLACAVHQTGKDNKLRKKR